MIIVSLDTAQEQRLRELATRLHQEPSEVVRRIVEAHLDAANWPADSEADWAHASVALMPKLFDDEPWYDANAGDTGGTGGTGGSGGNHAPR